MGYKILEVLILIIVAVIAIVLFWKFLPNYLKTKPPRSTSLPPSSTSSPAPAGYAPLQMSSSVPECTNGSTDCYMAFYGKDSSFNPNTLEGGIINTDEPRKCIDECMNNPSCGAVLFKNNSTCLLRPLDRFPEECKQDFSSSCLHDADSDDFFVMKRSS